MENRLFVANKPAGISSNHFLSRLKRKYGVKKAGFSGTLDPFASGCLIVAFGAYTRLFNYLKKSPKTYEATIWLGAFCDSLDNENITKIENLPPFSMQILEQICQKMLGEISYIPPKFSAKKINGKRAYKMARNGENFELKECKMTIFECEILHYFHPFLTLKLSVSSGAYIRSYAKIFGENLGVDATLSALKRVSEGAFVFENERALNPLEFLEISQNFYKGDVRNLMHGKRLNLGDFSQKNDGKYFVKFGENFTIFEIRDGEIHYCLNNLGALDEKLC